ncbi:hypothetical protein ADUPG1_009253 [Aduncisulcus paluster]|uniref:Uncharacterized protein n=1 Tax=Aduncisulcus paluster TaxID=2918883 RepID=A0ABQ5KV08_9EUKA|nr:hypothetical protein ADUPG1_009253 [Aduncisulcus paluster]
MLSTFIKSELQTEASYEKKKNCWDCGEFEAEKERMEEESNGKDKSDIHMYNIMYVTSDMKDKSEPSLIITKHSSSSEINPNIYHSDLSKQDNPDRPNVIPSTSSYSELSTSELDSLCISSTI